jgi:hypothetical protein
VQHCSVLQNRQIKAAAVEGHEAWLPLLNVLEEALQELLLEKGGLTPGTDLLEFVDLQTVFHLQGNFDEGNCDDLMEQQLWKLLARVVPFIRDGLDIEGEKGFELHSRKQ